MTTTTGMRVYDDFTTPELDMSRWAFLEYPPGPDGSSWRCAEPNARTSTGTGALTVHIERFTRAHDHVAIMDNPKHLLLSTESFTVPAAGAVTVALDLAVTGIVTAPRDFRDGFAALNVLDMASGWVFDACASTDMLFAIHERLPMPRVERPFTHVVEEPLAAPQAKPGAAHRHEVRLDRGQGVAEWRVDDILVHHLHGAEIPERITVGIGIFTLHRIVDGRSTSLRGQGLSATFGPVSVGAYDNRE